MKIFSLNTLKIILYLLLLTTIPQTVLSEDKAVGAVVAIRGEVNAVDTENFSRKLSLKSEIFKSDTIITGKRGRIQIMFLDNTIVSLGRNSEMKISEYKWNPDENDGEMKTKVKEGVFRIMGGAITKAAPKKFTTETPAATIGIRGSMYSGKVENESLTVLFQGGKGIEITNSYGSVAITQAGYGTQVRNLLEPPKPPIKFSSNDISNIEIELSSQWGDMSENEDKEPDHPPKKRRRKHHPDDDKINEDPEKIHHQEHKEPFDKKEEHHDDSGNFKENEGAHSFENEMPHEHQGDNTYQEPDFIIEHDEGGFFDPEPPDVDPTEIMDMDIQDIKQDIENNYELNENIEIWKIYTTGIYNETLKILKNFNLSINEETEFLPNPLFFKFNDETDKIPVNLVKKGNYSDLIWGKWYPESEPTNVVRDSGYWIAGRQSRVDYVINELVERTVKIKYSGGASGIGLTETGGFTVLPQGKFNVEVDFGNHELSGTIKFEDYVDISFKETGIVISEASGDFFNYIANSIDTSDSGHLEGTFFGHNAGSTAGYFDFTKNSHTYLGIFYGEEEKRWQSIIGDNDGDDNITDPIDDNITTPDPTPIDGFLIGKTKRSETHSVKFSSPDGDLSKEMNIQIDSGSSMSVNFIQSSGRESLLTYGTWETSSTLFDIVDGSSFWIAGTKTPSDYIKTNFIDISPEIVVQYSGLAYGSKIDSSGNISDLGFGGFDTTIYFGTYKIDCNFHFEGESTLHLAGNDIFDNTIHDYSFFKANQIDGEITSRLEGMFFGNNANVIGGIFDSQTTNAQYVGIFAGGKQMATDILITGFATGISKSNTGNEIFPRILMGSSELSNSGLKISIDSKSGAFKEGILSIYDESTENLINFPFDPGSVTVNVNEKSMSADLKTPDIIADSSYIVAASKDLQDIDSAIWGYWETSYIDPETGSQYDIKHNYSYWIAGVKTPKEKISALHSANQEITYQGTAHGSKTTPDGLSHDLPVGTTNMNVHFGNREINGNIHFEEYIDLQISSNEFNDLGDFNATATNSNVVRSKISGSFYGAEANSIGGNFQAETNENIKYTGIFSGNK